MAGKDKREKKTERVTVLLTSEEFGVIEKKARAARVQPSALCRQYIFKGIGAIQTDIFK